MNKSIIITEKPSVARDFASVLGTFENKNGYLESEDYIITWCIGHLVRLSYPEVYDDSLKQWKLETLPFIPQDYLYEVIPEVEKQFKVIKSLFNRTDVDTVFYAGDSAREGEYIQRLLRDMTIGRNNRFIEKRVWIDSQTEEEILKGIKNAKPLKDYDNLSDAAYLRAIEDFLIGINFSRAISLKYASTIQAKFISVGRVMSCVLGMIVERERSIYNFNKTPYFGILAEMKNEGLTAEWRAVAGSRFFEHPILYKENGFCKKEDAERLMSEFQSIKAMKLIEKEIVMETKYAPLLFNLAELQNECSRILKISPDETLKIAQKLYESKIITYPRTDARVITTAIANEIDKNLRGFSNLEAGIEIMQNGWHQNLANTKYVDDKAVSDHYAIIPTGANTGLIRTLPPLEKQVFTLILNRFFAIFYPPAKYQKSSLVFACGSEKFFHTSKELVSIGYLKIAKPDERLSPRNQILQTANKGDVFQFDFSIKESETSPPKPYTSGSIILAMENAGQLIEDEELRAEIKGSGIGTSATRAEIIKKLIEIGHIQINEKTQRLSVTANGEMVYEVLKRNAPSILSPVTTASWEKGLSMVARGEITKDFFYEKLTSSLKQEMNYIIKSDFQNEITSEIAKIKAQYGVKDSVTMLPKGALKCPVCGKHEMVEYAWGFGCTGYKDNSCKFSIGNKLGEKYGVNVSKTQQNKLIKTGKTDFYDNLKGSKGVFAARFVIKENGTIGFEFKKRDTEITHIEVDLERKMK